MKNVIMAFAAALAVAGSAPAQTPPEPDDDITVQTPPEVEPVDSPLARLDEIRSALAASPGASGDVAGELAKASLQLDRARRSMAALEPNLRSALARIRTAQRRLATAARRAAADPDRVDEIGRWRADLSEVGRAIADGWLELAERAAVPPRMLSRAQAALAAGDLAVAAGDHTKAGAAYAKTLNIKNALDFDSQTFIASVQGDLAFSVTGYAVVVNRHGQPVNSFATGLRQTIIDSNPVVPLGLNDEVHLASVSKTLTAVGVLIQLQKMGPDVEALLASPIGPYLPPDWVPGANVAELTFEELLTQKTGLGGRDSEGNRKTCPTSWDGMKACVELGVDPADKVYHYNNANFALFRAMLYYMQGFACGGFPWTGFCPGFTALTYATHMQCNVFAAMGLAAPPGDGPCGGPGLAPNLAEGPEALLYDSREPALGGVSAGDWYFTGGGGGWYMSAMELAQFLAHVRYNDKVLKPKTRQLMYDRFLGWLDPNAWTGFTAGKLGTYRMHGGGVCYPQPGSEGTQTCFRTKEPGNSTCIADLPAGVQAVLLINSRRGDYGEACSVVKRAYEAAWVAK
ncbi:serine hydrolase [bacterium]|nr:serine hydrolase [bacterium]